MTEIVVKIGTWFLDAYETCTPISNIPKSIIHKIISVKQTLLDIIFFILNHSINTKMCLGKNSEIKKSY